MGGLAPQGQLGSEVLCKQLRHPDERQGWPPTLLRQGLTPEGWGTSKGQMGGGRMPVLLKVTCGKRLDPPQSQTCGWLPMARQQPRPPSC